MSSRSDRTGRNHRSDASTNSTTDVRRAQQRARSAVREAESSVMEWVRQNPEIVAALGATAGAGAGAVTLSSVADTLTDILTEAFRSLIIWMRNRKRLTARRAIRSAHERLNYAVVQPVDSGDLSGNPTTLEGVEAILTRLDARDEGAFLPSGGRGSPTTQSLSNRVATEIAQQLSIASRADEPREKIATRVSGVMSKGPEELADRRENGIAGDTALTRAERLAHDALQSAYMASYAKTLLNNGVRYGTYVAVLDRRTTELCQRLHGVIVDMVETPLLIPPNHWWCRSNLIPLLALPPGREPIAESEVGHEYRVFINRWRSSDTGNYLPIDTAIEFNPESRLSEDRYDPVDVGVPRPNSG